MSVSGISASAQASTLKSTLFGVAKVSAPVTDALKSAAAQATSALASPSLTLWKQGRPGYEMKASTDEVNLQNNATTSAQIKVTLKKGAGYTFSANGSYSYSGKKPTATLTLTDAAGKVVKSSKTASLTLSAAETQKLANGDYTFSYQITPAKGAIAYLRSYRLDAVQNLSTLPSSSGNSDLNAILAGGSNWWHDTGAVASVSNTSITPTVKGISGARTTLYYDFLGGNENFLTADDKSGFKAMDDGQKTAVVSALSYLSSLINVEFVQKDAQHAADLAFGTNQQTSSAGYAKYPLGNGNDASVVMLDNLDTSNAATNTGAQMQDKTSYAWYTLLHEVGHSLGLKHPGAYNAGGGKTPGPYLSSAKDNRLTTVMSYNDAPGSQKLAVSGNESSYSYSATGVAPTSYKALDIAALQYLYGAKTQTVAQDLTVSDGYDLYNTIWAPQGVKLNASSTTRTNVFDLREGGYSSVSILTASDQIASLKTGFKNSGVSDAKSQAYATQLVTNTKALKGKLFDGKNTLGLAWGSSYTEITGGSSDDRFYASSYSTSVVGGAGKDTLYLQGTAKQWTQVIGTDGTATYTSKLNGAVITAKGIEAVAYYKATAAAT